jgi:SAM-dependent methyltransferase
VRREARRLLGRAPAGAPLLEIGCGTGRFLERVRAVGYDGPLRGLEYSPDVAAATAERLGIPVEAGDVEDADLRRDEYGAIVLRHVIEHVRDPAEVVGRLHAALRPGGVLYLGTPDVRALSAQAFGRYWWGWEVPRHLVVFSAPALRALLERTGFEIEAEWAGFAPQMWNASLSLWLDRGGRRPRTPLATHLLNPVVTGPACVAAGLEVATGRSTMYAVLARRPLATMGRDA